MKVREFFIGDHSTHRLAARESYCEEGGGKCDKKKRDPSYKRPGPL